MEAMDLCSNHIKVHVTFGTAYGYEPLSLGSLNIMLIVDLNKLFLLLVKVC
jgi:hypothetical protein